MGDARFGRDVRKLGDFGRDQFGYGSGLTEEGLAGLRGLRGTYEQRLKDPLGEVGRSIFARARGNLADDFTRTVNSGDARAKQLALQSGGSLTPEQISALDQENRRAASEGLFRGESDLSTGEADLTMKEMSSFFDRMEGIDRTITGVGQDEKTRGLQSIIQSLISRHNRNAAIASTAAGVWGGGNQQWGGK